MGKAWYVLRTESRAEYMAANALESDGYEVYLPKVKTPTPRIGHFDVPLFPGYLFLRCDIESQGWPMFHREHRVAGWIRFDGSVSPIPDDIVSRYQQHGVRSSLGPVGRPERSLSLNPNLRRSG